MARKKKQAENSAAQALRLEDEAGEALKVAMDAREQHQVSDTELGQAIDRALDATAAPTPRCEVCDVALGIAEPREGMRVCYHIGCTPANSPISGTLKQDAEGWQVIDDKDGEPWQLRLVDLEALELLSTPKGETTGSETVTETTPEKVACTECGGDGKPICQSCNGGGVDRTGEACGNCDKVPDCPRCGGTGEEPKEPATEPCAKCHGEGDVPCAACHEHGCAKCVEGRLVCPECQGAKSVPVGTTPAPVAEVLPEGQEGGAR